MSDRSITVIGAGVAGMAAAVVLARRGYRVVLLERDQFDVGAAEDAFEWRRSGIPHFLQPHAFIPRGRLEMRRNLPDVYQALLDVGAYEVDIRAKLPGPVEPADEELQYLAVRRPVVEWALRRAVLAEPHIEVRSGAKVQGLSVEDGRVTGVRLADGELLADWVVDAHGRRLVLSSWLAGSGIDVPEPETSDCGVVYYSRYYRQRPGFELPDGPWFLSPRGDLGYLAFASFPGDNATFATILAAPPGVPEWRVFNDESAYEAAVASIPALSSWVDPNGVDPITDVLPMAGLRNSLIPGDQPVVAGLFPVGDAYCHTDPTLAHGLAFALIHATELAAALDDHADPIDAFGAYAAATMPALRERYDWASALDAQRRRVWMGDKVDFAHHDGDYALFTLAAAGAVARADPEVFRVFNRRMGLLDSTDVLDSDLELQRRIERDFQAMRSNPPPPLGPGREEMLATVGAAG